MCCAACACEASTSSSNGGVNNDANWTARKITPSNSQAASGEGPAWERVTGTGDFVMTLAYFKLQDISRVGRRFAMEDASERTPRAAGEAIVIVLKKLILH